MAGAQSKWVRDAYAARNRILRDMGFSSYREYLASGLWARVRARVLSGSPTCVVCSRPATEVHHGSYRREDLDGSDLANLHPVCRRHHEWAEFRGDGAKRTPYQTMRVLEAKRRERAAREEQQRRLLEKYEQARLKREARRAG